MPHAPRFTLRGRASCASNAAHVIAQSQEEEETLNIENPLLTLDKKLRLPTLRDPGILQPLL